ncbi:MAG: adenosine deaminase family protein, partial [Chloroflexota bacterium]|nr:adenosine deaminase family protein [Chloroflexota bacterium]
DVRTNLIIQIGRDATVRTARELARVALAHADQGVVGLDLAGDERRYPAAPFIDIFRQARRDGLHVTVHAGEAGPARNIEEAIADLEAERIGHGIRCVEDPNVVSLIRERNVTLEVCPTSNVQTGVVRDLCRHPLPELVALRLPVSVNTDDPSVSDTTLTDEYRVAVSTMSITLDQIKHMIVTAAEASFQPPDDRERLAVWFRRKLALDDETDTTGEPQ